MYSPAAINKISSKEASARIRAVGFVLLRYGLVLVIAWIAAMKATEYEAKGIQPLIAHSPLLSWGYQVWTVRHFSMIIGATELIIAALIAMRH
jgi:reactive chlorine resistance protein C